MRNKGYFTISRAHLKDLFSVLSKEADVYLPAKKGSYLYCRLFDPEYKGEYIVDEIRPVEPVKSFFTRSRQRVDGEPKIAKGHRRQILFGVKNCDITSLKIQDFVFKDTQPQDPFYMKKREDTTIISCDCNLLWESCFCVALDINPYPESGFDLNLSRNADNFLVEVGSDRGGNIIERNRALFAEASDHYVKKRNGQRDAFREGLKRQVQGKQTPVRESIIGSIKKSYNVDQIWLDFASTCIECGGCNHCCPACHCFQLTDEKKDQIKARYRSWDACLYNRFARVAGGANPRKHLHERLRNRFDKKFEFFQNVLGIFGCTGCGRCIEVCPGKIDIREVLKRTVAGK